MQASTMWLFYPNNIKHMNERDYFCILMLILPDFGSVLSQASSVVPTISIG